VSALIRYPSPPAEARWLPVFRRTGEHRDGVPWDVARRPWRWHVCRPQTRLRLSGGLMVERCACGGQRLTEAGLWARRNVRPRRHDEAPGWAWVVLLLGLGAALAGLVGATLAVVTP